jgi:hypothetical protein
MRVNARCTIGGLGALLLAGCGARGEPSPGATPAVDQDPVRAADSLVLTLGSGATVWLTEGRRATDSSGATCVERSVEIRRDSIRLKVPLLYTGSTPTALDDSTFKAELFRDCRPSASYKVNVRDAQPHRINP